MLPPDFDQCDFDIGKNFIRGVLPKLDLTKAMYRNCCMLLHQMHTLSITNSSNYGGERRQKKGKILITKYRMWRDNMI